MIRFEGTITLQGELMIQLDDARVPLKEFLSTFDLGGEARPPEESAAERPATAGTVRGSPRSPRSPRRLRKA